MKLILFFVLLSCCNCLFGQVNNSLQESRIKDTVIYAYTLSIGMTAADKLDSIHMLAGRYKAKHLKSSRYASTLWFVVLPALDTMYAPMKRNAWPGMGKLKSTKGYKVMLKAQVFRGCLVNNLRPKIISTPASVNKRVTKSDFTIVNEVIID